METWTKKTNKHSGLLTFHDTVKLRGLKATPDWTREPRRTRVHSAALPSVPGANGETWKLHLSRWVPGVWSSRVDAGCRWTQMLGVSSCLGVWGQVWSRLEGLPVDGSSSVLLVFPLGHPHLLKGVQRRQDGAADPCGVEPLLGSRDLDLHVFGCQFLDFS